MKKAQSHLDLEVQHCSRFHQDQRTYDQIPKPDLQAYALSCGVNPYQNKPQLYDQLSKVKGMIASVALKGQNAVLEHALRKFHNACVAIQNSDPSTSNPEAPWKTMTALELKEIAKATLLKEYSSDQIDRMLKHDLVRLLYHHMCGQRLPSKLTQTQGTQTENGGDGGFGGGGGGSPPMPPLEPFRPPQPQPSVVMSPTFNCPPYPPCPPCPPQVAAQSTVEVAMLNAQLSNLQQQLRECTEALRDARDKFARADAERAQLQTYLQTCNDDAKRVQSEFVQGHLAQTRAKDEQIAQLQSQLNESKQQFRTLNTEISKLDTKYQKALQEITIRRQQEPQFQQQFANVQAELDRARAETNAMRQEFNQAEAEWQNERSKRRTMDIDQTQERRLRNDIEELQNELSAAKHETNRVREDLRREKAKSKEIETEIADLKDDLDRAKRETATLKRELSTRLEAKYVTSKPLGEELDALQKRLKDCEEKSQSRVDDLERKLRESEENNRSLAKSDKMKSDRISELETRNRELNDQLDSDDEKLQQQNNELKAQMDRQEKEIKSLERKNKELIVKTQADGIAQSDEFRARIEEKERELKTEQSKNAKLQSNLKDVNQALFEQRSEAETKITKLENELAAERLKQKASEFGQTQASATEMNLGDKYEDLIRRNNERYRNELKRMQDALDLQVLTAGQTLNELQSTQDDLARLANERAIIDQRLADALNLASTQEREIKQWELKYKNLRKQFTERPSPWPEPVPTDAPSLEAVSSAQETSNELKQCQDELAQANKTRLALEAELNTYRATLDIKQKCCDDLKQSQIDLELARKALLDCETKTQQLQTDMTKLRANHASCETKLADCQTTTAALRASLSQPTTQTSQINMETLRRLLSEFTQTFQTTETKQQDAIGRQIDQLGEAIAVIINQLGAISNTQVSATNAILQHTTAATNAILRNQNDAAFWLARGVSGIGSMTLNGIQRIVVDMESLLAQFARGVTPLSAMEFQNTLAQYGRQLQELITQVPTNVVDEVLQLTMAPQAPPALAAPQPTAVFVPSSSGVQIEDVTDLPMPQTQGEQKYAAYQGIYDKCLNDMYYLGTKLPRSAAQIQSIKDTYLQNLTKCINEMKDPRLGKAKKQLETHAKKILNTSVRDILNRKIGLSGSVIYQPQLNTENEICVDLARHVNNNECGRDFKTVLLQSAPLQQTVETRRQYASRLASQSPSRRPLGARLRPLERQRPRSTLPRRPFVIREGQPVATEQAPIIPSASLSGQYEQMVRSMPR